MMACTPETTLVQAKEWLAAMKLAGLIVDCPCCTRRAKVYKRTLNGPLARALVMLYRYDVQFPGEFVHVNDYLKRFGIVMHDFSFLKFWGMVEQKSGERPDGSIHNGFWRITSLGRRFAAGEYKVPANCYVDNNKVDAAWGENGYGGEWISVSDALSSGGFNFSELMSQESDVVRAARVGG